MDIVELDLTANEVYDILMKRLENCNNHLSDKNGVLWYLRKITVLEVMDDLLHDIIENPSFEYFEEPKPLKEEYKLYNFLCEIDDALNKELLRQE